jgi:hypothetical protein
MCPHIEAQEHLTDLESRKMISRTYALETASHVLYKTCSLERVHSPGEMERKIAVMEVLHKVD